MRKKSKYSEENLAEVVVNWLESKNWDVYQEVQFRGYGPVADIVAIKDNQMWMIESKLALGFSVLAQAEKWQCHYRSVAVPRATKGNNSARRLAYKVCRDCLGIGIMEISPAGWDVFVVVAPKLQDNVDVIVKRQQAILNPHHKNFAKAGSSGSKHYTPYKQTMLEIKEFITNNPKCTLNDIIDHVGKAHYASEASAKNGIRVALTTWETWSNCKWDTEKRAMIYQLKEKEGLP